LSEIIMPVPLHICVIGASGRLGGAMAHALQRAGHRVFALGHSELDITDETKVAAMVASLQPQAIVNCCAYNAVDAAEDDPTAAFAVNATGPRALARAAARVGAVIVHYSTDFVFDGEASGPYLETAPTNPLSVYGASKLAGEDEVRHIEGHYILRVESLFGGTSTVGCRATIDYMADTLTAGLPVRAIADRTVSPSYVDDVVRATRTLLEERGQFGTYHCVSSGCTTWYELANEIARQLNTSAPVVPVLAQDFPTRAVRPRFCALSNRKLGQFGIELPSWTAALARHLAARRMPTGADLPPRIRIA
jgi:dTDP-4-dehydrorhamnose reductase